MPVGCFKDKTSARALPEMLANFRIKTAKWPEKLNWSDIEGTVVKKCAAKVRFQRCLFTILRQHCGCVQRLPFENAGLSK